MSVSARYWRLRATGDCWFQNYPNFMHAYTISGFESSDGSGTDRFLVGTASASSVRTASYPATNANDGDDATEWMTPLVAAGRQWWACDINTNQTIRSLSVLSFFDSQNGRRWPRTFAVDYSADAVNWTEMIGGIIAPNTSGLQTFDISASAASGIARPMIDGWGHSRFIDSRMMIR